MSQYLNIDIDASDLNAKLTFLENVMKPKQFESAMYGVFKRTGGHVKTILKRDLPNKYSVKPAEVGETVKAPQLSTGGNNLGCSIPIRGTRRHFGGNHGFPAKGYARGWNSVKRGTYPVMVQVVKGSWKPLPYDLGPGHMKPFRNIPANRLNKMAFYRNGKPRFPISKVSSIAIPQMPMNRSQEDVQKDIATYLENRVNARITALLANGK